MVVAPQVVLQPSLRSVECVTDGYVHVLVSVVFGPFTIDGDLAPRHDEPESHVVQLAFVVMLVRSLDQHVAGGDPIMKAVESSCALSNARVDSRRWVHATECDVKWYLHML
jgi:hypothetical protein